MKSYSNIEQVGFLDKNFLRMAGGEFCGNATRSAAFILLKGEPGEIKLKVSGVKNYLKAGIKENRETYSEMPIFNSINKITQIKTNNQPEFLVKMKGITHLINFNYQQIVGLSNDEIKNLAKNRINKNLSFCKIIICNYEYNLI